MLNLKYILQSIQYLRLAFVILTRNYYQATYNENYFTMLKKVSFISFYKDTK